MESPATVRALGEEGVIALFFGPSGAADPRLVIPNGDDAAAWRSPAGLASVITTDSLVEGQHFDLTYSPARAVGRKLLAVNLSDLAAMGARPRFALISVCFPPSASVAVVREIGEGLSEACRENGVVVIGGNTAGIAGPMVLTATLVGEAAPERLVKREGAQADDGIFVTGRLGDAVAGYHAATHGRRPRVGEPEYPLFQALIDPTARVDAGVRLAELGALSAMCDVSDGLGRDLRRLLALVGLGAEIEVTRLPISEALRAYAQNELEASRWAMAGGEDYELLFTAPVGHEPALRAACREAQTDLSRIGRVTSAPAVQAVFPDGRVEPVPTGFEHFESGRP